MIYLVSGQSQLYPTDVYETITVTKALKILRDWKTVQVDTETNGLNPHINNLITVQFGNKKADIQFVIDCSTVDIKCFKDVLESKLLILHNAKFDLQFFFKKEIVPRKVYDTMIAEQTLYQGYPFVTMYKSEYEDGEYTFPYLSNGPFCSISYTLKALSHKYLGVERDKTIRAEIKNLGLTDEVIQYAADDVKDLEDIMKLQLQAAKRENCTKAIALECACIPGIAYMEFCGVKLDIQKWTDKMKADEAKLHEAEKALNAFVIKTNSLKHYTYRNLQGDLWNGFDTEPKVSINWASSKQVIPVAKILGFNTTVQDKKTGQNKDSVLEKALKIQKGINDEFLKLYFDYQGYSKVVSSFGQAHLDAINPVTGRLHTKYSQLGASSGRLSCGGGEDSDLCSYKKLPAHSCKYLNLQQLPHDEQTRACFVAEPGNLWVSCDFSAEESVLLTDITKDAEYYKEFTEGTKDSHNLFAWICYNKECRERGCKDASEVKAKAKDIRNKVKPVEFAYGFGAGPDTIAKTAGISLEEAEALVKTMDASFTGLSAFKKEAATKVKKLGYILICPETGHRLRWWDHKKWLATQASFTREFWDEFKQKHKGSGDDVALTVRQHFQAADKYSKLGLNSCTQGTGAIIFKYAITKLFDWIVENNHFNKVKICVGVHDEINCEFPETLTTFPQTLQSIMESSAAKFCHSLPIPACPDVEKFWKH